MSVIYMKNALFSIIILLMLFGLCACGKDAKKTDGKPTVTVVEGQPIEQLDDVSVYIGVTGESKDLGSLPAYTYNDGHVSYNKMNPGRYGQVNHVFSNTDAASFINYLNSLENDGWVQYSNNIIEGTNLFATYTKGEGSVYCYYISAKSRAYIIESPDQNMEARESDNQYQKICDPILTQLKLPDEAYGMGYLIRLGDGRFIVIDGGLRAPGDQSSKQLMDTIQKQNVLDKVTIAAWILTHPHKDHIGVATEVLLKYKPSELEIQRLILNFPTDDDLRMAESDAIDDTADAGKLPTFLMALNARWKDLPITVCHTGQEFYFADAKIEILRTIEDYAPKTITSLNEYKVNGSSVVLRVEIDGQKTIFFADASEEESEDLVKMWGSYLKSDIMQANHHGLEGGSIQLYELTDPTVVMVPGANRDVDRILEYEYSRWIWNNVSGNIREVMIYDWEQRELNLPYVPSPDTPYFSDQAKDPWGGVAHLYKTAP